MFPSGGGVLPPQTVKNHASQSQDRNNKYFILYIEFCINNKILNVTFLSILPQQETKIKDYGTLHQLKFPSTFIEYRSVSEWKGVVVISNFDSLEAAPSNLPP